MDDAPQPIARLMPKPRSAAKPARPVRKDPSRPRPVDGVAPWARMVNKRPDRHYVLVFTGDPEAMATYPALGFVPEVYEEGGVQPAGGWTGKAGENIVARDHMLMSIDIESWNQIQQYGPDGQTGYELHDRIEEQIIARRGEHDPIRGANGRTYIDFENDTQPEEHVRA